MNTLELEDSDVRRAGVTSSRWSYATSSITVTAEESLDFRFKVSSKGGGETDIMLSVGKDDIPCLIELIANSMPDLAPDIAKSAHLAITNLVSESNNVSR
jgi:hypothetical protein